MDGWRCGELGEDVLGVVLVEPRGKRLMTKPSVAVTKADGCEVAG
jgi:hypothetical protein